MLKSRIMEKKARVVVIGLGYVGLPLALNTARAGFKVIGIDMQEDKVSSVNKGVSYIDDIANKDLAKTVKSGNMRASCNFSLIKKADIVIICVPTPLTKNKTPDISYVESVSMEIAKYLHKDMLVILESTTFPGTTDEIVKPLLEKSGLKAGRDFFLVFSPERVDPGVKGHEAEKIPKVVGGMTRKGSEVAEAFYRNVVKKVHIVSSPKVAEIEKLLENIFRVVNISLVNEMALLCDRMGIDIWEAIDAAATKPYGYMPFYPGPGLGGHCIPIDPFYLTWKAKEYNFSSRFIELAGEINDAMPHFMVTKVIVALNNVGKCLKGANILVLGVAYKKNISDTRESPVLTIIELLQHKHAKVRFNDPYVPEVRIAGRLSKSVKLTKKALKEADLVFIATAHDVYTPEFIVKNSKVIVDARNLIKDRNIKKVTRL